MIGSHGAINDGNPHAFAGAGHRGEMAAGRRRAKYLATLVLAFSYLGGGLLSLASYPLISYFVLFAGMLLLMYSAAGLFQPPKKHETFLRRK